MSQPPPLPVDYESSRPKQPQKFDWQMFFLAFLIGSGISAIVWIGQGSKFNNGSIVAFIILIPLVKIVGGIVMAYSDKWRPAGIGVLLSLLVGCGVFFSVCANNMDFR